MSLVELLLAPALAAEVRFSAPVARRGDPVEVRAALVDCDDPIVRVEVEVETAGCSGRPPGRVVWRAPAAATPADCDLDYEVAWPAAAVADCAGLYELSWAAAGGAEGTDRVQVVESDDLSTVFAGFDLDALTEGLFAYARYLVRAETAAPPPFASLVAADAGGRVTDVVELEGSGPILWGGGDTAAVPVPGGVALVRLDGAGRFASRAHVAGADAAVPGDPGVALAEGRLVELRPDGAMGAPLAGGEEAVGLLGLVEGTVAAVALRCGRTVILERPPGAAGFSPVAPAARHLVPAGLVGRAGYLRVDAAGLQKGGLFLVPRGCSGDCSPVSLTKSGATGIVYPFTVGDPSISPDETRLLYRTTARAWQVPVER